jgi:uncharacterized membrane-anchored protein
MKNRFRYVAADLQTAHGRMVVAVGAFVVGLVGFAVPSFAASVDPTADVTTFATSAISQLYPIVLAVAGAMVALLVLRWGVSKVLGVLRGRSTV